MCECAQGGYPMNKAFYICLDVLLSDAKHTDEFSYGSEFQNIDALRLSGLYLKELKTTIGGCRRMEWVY